MSKTIKPHWRSLEDLHDGETVRPELHREFWSEDASTEDASTLAKTPIDRRRFLGTVGTGAAIAGIAATPGCIRKPVENLVPYRSRPEDLIPGRPRYFRTASHDGGRVLGLHVESQDGRPTKVEGNPAHPMSLGAANTYAQASVLDLYDPNRSTKPQVAGQDVTWEVLWKAVETAFEPFAGNGNGIALLTDAVPSPTVWRLTEKLQKRYPGAKVYRHDAVADINEAAGLRMVGLRAHRVSYDLSRAKVVLALDADLFGNDGDSVRNARKFADGRRVESPDGTMNRLYAVEARFTTTGMMADHRLRVPSSHIGEALRGVAGHVLGAGFPAELLSETQNRKTREPGSLAWNTGFEAFVAALTEDLAANKGACAVVVGPRMPAWAHGLAAAVNEALGNTNKTVFYAENAGAGITGGVAELVADIRAKRISALVMSHTNPGYDAPADLDFAGALGQVPVKVHHGYYRDETARLATHHIPASHYLEAWGDLLASDGTLAIQQPLIAPLFDTVSQVELLGRLTGDTALAGYNHVRETQAGVNWDRAVHDGVVTGPNPISPNFAWAGLGAALKRDAGPARPQAGSLELNFSLDGSVLDGRYANNGWLQELPDTLTKLTWDNAALVNQATAKAVGVANGELTTVSLGGKSVTLPVWITPGLADFTVTLSVGYGREGLGHIAEGAGFDVSPLRTVQGFHTAQGARLKGTGETVEMATTQEHGYLVEPLTGHKRPMVRENTMDGYRQKPDFVIEDEMVKDKSKLKSLWTEPNKRDGRQWGMAIDLTTCTGCNACTIACNAENNVPVVGKDRVLDGREMHWIRIDRYFVGTEDAPEAVVQPVGCMHCETAPCENVCPVAATSHSPEGLNDMAYNRCIGTRYCANNCPFKVRRFNFFNFQKENRAEAPLWGMQKNPDVTVRFRGVMEKCTYCIQRITEARIEAKRQGHGIIPDIGPNAALPACVQTCPPQAIVFGDINNPESRVAQAKARPRNYTMLAELNVHARTSYLAKLRNPNPKLVITNG